MQHVDSDRDCEIMAMVVDERFRGQGYGRQLLAAAENWAITRGVHHMRVRSSIARERAHHFYDNLGYTRSKNQLVFNKTLQVPAESTPAHAH